jgi:hypothetical protein
MGYIIPIKVIVTDSSRDIFKTIYKGWSSQLKHVNNEEYLQKSLQLQVENKDNKKIRGTKRELKCQTL